VRDVGFEDKPICGAGFYPLYLWEKVRVREVGVKERETLGSKINQ